MIHTPLQLGQTFTPAGLIYTVRGPDDERWFCDSRRNWKPLGILRDHHADVVVDPGDLEMFDLGTARWTRGGIERYVRGDASGHAYETWKSVAAFIRRFFVGADDVVDVCTTFAMASYVFTVAETVPYIHLVGEPATGKTLLGELLEALCFNARQASSMSPAAIHRLVHATNGTLVLDEQASGDRAWHHLMRAGYRRSGTVIVCEGTTPVERRCFGPKVLITNDPITDEALASRTIRFVLDRTTQRAERYTTLSAGPAAADIRDQLHAFGLASALACWRAYQQLGPVPGVTHRDEDLAGLLLAVAMVVDHSSHDGSSGLAERIMALLRRRAEERRSRYRLEAERPALARAITQFIAASPRRYVYRGHDDWYVASDFTEFLNGSGELSRELGTKQVGERLNRYSLVLEREVIDIPQTAAPIQLKARRVQKVAYRFAFTAVNSCCGSVS